MNNQEPIWHQLPNENSRQFYLFNLYRDVPPNHKLMPTVQKQAQFKSLRYLYVLHAKFNWAERRHAYQRHLKAEADKAQAAAVVSVAKAAGKNLGTNWAHWHMENMEKARKIADQLFQKTQEIVHLPLLKQTKQTDPVFDIEGNPVFGRDGKQLMQNITILQPSRFSVSDAPRFAEAALVLAQYVREQMTALSPPVDRDMPIPSKPLDEMNADELDEYIAACRAAKDAIVRGDTIDETGGWVL